MEFHLSAEASREIELLLEQGLAASSPVAGPRNVVPLVLTVSRPNNTIGAGLTGATYWEWLHIRLLWVADDLRGEGIGRELVKRAESEAQRRGCRGAIVDTYTFQAPEFYRRLGYRLVGGVDDYPLGHRREYFQKRFC